MSRAMPPLFRRLGLACPGLALTVSVAASAIASPAFAADTGQIACGQYMATASDCVACHTAPGGAAMAGGLSIATPIGAIVATNITPSKANGIGAYTLEQFDAALRKGVRADGKQLYPAMPYTAYAQLFTMDGRIALSLTAARLIARQSDPGMLKAVCGRDRKNP